MPRWEETDFFHFLVIHITKHEVSCLRKQQKKHGQKPKSQKRSARGNSRNNLNQEFFSENFIFDH